MQQLNDKELLRYDRQITLKGFDIDKQERLKNASALIIGMGGLGCSASLYLCCAGIGHLTLVDFDVVSDSNLHRQILFTKQSIGQNKAEQAKLGLLQHNDNIAIETMNAAPTHEQLLTLISQHEIVLDCTDNITSREQLNQCCYLLKKPLISGAAIRMEGLLSVFTYRDDAPCYHCLSQLFGQEQLTCVEAGVMAPLVGMIGSMQAMEAIKVITHYGTPLSSRLLMIDAMTMQFNEVMIPKQSHCSVCAHE